MTMCSCDFGEPPYIECSIQLEDEMGQAKHEMMRMDTLVGQATGVLLKTGALKACELHEDIVIDQYDDDAVKRAYAIGTNMVKAGEVDGTREEFMDAIKTALEQGYDECPDCTKHMED